MSSTFSKNLNASTDRNSGTWRIHCHILPHAEPDRGMFGMVTALVVQA